jgi:hypothetical protein
VVDDWGSYSAGLASAFAFCAIAVWLIVLWENRCKRIRALDEHAGTELAKTTVYDGPSYGLHVVKK